MTPIYFKSYILDSQRYPLNFYLKKNEEGFVHFYFVNLRVCADSFRKSIRKEIHKTIINFHLDNKVIRFALTRVLSVLLRF